MARLTAADSVISRRYLIGAELTVHFQSSPQLAALLAVERRAPADAVRTLKVRT